MSQKNKTYKLNQSAFDEITELSAYWIGFLMADGCVQKKSKGFTDQIFLVLKPEDKQHLKKFKNFLDAENPIKKRKRSNKDYLGIQITSQEIVDQLAEFGVVPNKTKNAEVNGKLKSNRHFWRGVVDGDGSVAMYNNKPRIDLIGSKLLVNQFKDFVTDFCKTNASVLERNGSYSYRVNGKNVATEVIDKLYKNSNVYLDRKKRVADEIMNKYGDGSN